MSVTSIPDAELIRRAINSCGNPRRNPRNLPLWRQVSETFALGSTYSAELCRIHGFDPESTPR